MRILLVEDDPLQQESIVEVLRERMPEDTVIEQISTEFDCMSRLERIEEQPPDLIILDVMMRWTDPKPDMPLPPSHIKDVMGGLRCLRALRAMESFRALPVILYTVLEKTDLAPYGGLPPEDDPHLTWLGKGDLESLVDEIRRLLG